MATPGAPSTWVPYATTSDCSRRICSTYCPQWCYIVFPPPPPLGFFPDDPSSGGGGGGSTVSPFVIALIGILASALLLATYYLLVSRYCGGLGCLRRHRGRDDTPAEASEALRGDLWQQAPPAAAGGGLEEWIIRRIEVCKYKTGDGLVESSDCSVCLGEFRDGESLRLLPDCLHAFHVPCIDTWLKSHSNCPICRTNVVYTLAPPSQQPPPPPPPPPPQQQQPRSAAPPPPPRMPSPSPEIRHDSVAAPDAVRGRGGESRRLEGGRAPVSKGPLRNHGGLRGLDGRREAIELSEEGIPQDVPRRRSASGADALRMGAEGSVPLARDGGEVVEEVGSSRRLRVEQHACKAASGDAVLHCVVRPASPVKRSLAGGRFCFAGQGRGSNGSILPL